MSDIRCELPRAIAQRKNCVAAYLETSATAENNFDARDGLADSAAERSGIPGRVVANSTGFAGSVEVVDFFAELSVKRLGDFNGERSPRRNHGTQTLELLTRDVSFSQRAKERRHRRKEGWLPRLDRAGDRVRERRDPEYDRSTLNEQRHHEITEAVGVPPGNQSKVDILRADTHGRAQLASVGDQFAVLE